MAIIPKSVGNKWKNSANIINAIKSTDTALFTFDDAEYDIASISAIGTIVMSDSLIMNRFISALINRIAKVVYTSFMYENPLVRLKRGKLETGEIVEELAFRLCEVHTYDSTDDIAYMKQEKPKMLSAIHKLNYQKYYKQTINRAELRQAFLTLDGVENLATQIISMMYTSASYDEFLCMKYTIGRSALNGLLTRESIPTVSPENMKRVASKIKSLSNELTFVRTVYNPASVETVTPKENQIVVVNTEFSADLDVEVLAFAFNMDKVKFAGQQIMIDKFNDSETERMTALLGDNADYKAFTPEDVALLNTIPAYIIDDRLFQIYDYLEETGSAENPEKLYFNYWLHTWKIISTSPFVNAIMLSSDTPVIDSVVITPDTATVTKGQSLQFSTTVSGSGFYSKAVKYEIVETTNKSEIDSTGKLVVGIDEANTKLTVKVTSIEDSTKTASATVTIK